MAEEATTEAAEVVEEVATEEAAAPERKSSLADEETSTEEATAEESDTEGEASAETAELNFAEIELPDGIKLDEKALEHFAPELKALNVDGEQAKTLFTKFAAYQEQQIQAANDQFNSEWDADQAVIAKIPKEDLAAAKKARDAFFDETGVKLLSGRLGDVPAVVQALVKIGKAMAEDKFVEGGNAGNDTPTEDILFPTMK